MKVEKDNKTSSHEKEILNELIGIKKVLIEQKKQNRKLIFAFVLSIYFLAIVVTYIALVNN